MKKVLCIVCVMIMLVSVIVSACAEENWVCPDCGMRVPVSLGNECPRCGAMRPGHTPVPAAEPGLTSAPAPTLAPSPAPTSAPTLAQRAYTPKELFDFGKKYYDGSGVAQDYAEAMRWYRQAADAGYAAAMNDIGYMYQHGLGVGQDYGEAMKWYKRAADAGSSSGKSNIGYMYLHGLGVGQDYGEAMRWYKQAANEGNAAAMSQIGYMYSNGLGVGQDYNEAMRWYKQAANKGNATAMNEIGYMYGNGQGVSRDYSEAIKWYKQAAEAGSSTGKYNTGFMYDHGMGVAQDYEEAIKWYKQAADGGHARAMYQIGIMYEKGNGVTKDIKTAAEWMEKAKSHGFEDAEKWLLENAASDSTEIMVDEYITFTYGHYEQDNDSSNGPEPIEWQVLAKDGSKVLLISRYGLDARQYHSSAPYPTWEKSDIRSWLDSTFLNAAFTAAEQAGIVTTTVSTSSYYGQSGGADTQDKIWLLSREEVEKYFSSKESRKAPPTAYAVVQGAHQDSGDQSQYKVNGEGCCWWWLRSPGYYSDTASVVGHGGSLSSYEDYYVYIAYNAVRPALWLDLDLAAF